MVKKLHFGSRTGGYISHFRDSHVANVHNLERVALRLRAEGRLRYQMTLDQRSLQ